MNSLTPQAAPPWLRPLVDNVGRISWECRRQLSPQVADLLGAGSGLDAGGRDAAVLVLFSGPAGGSVDDADLLLTTRASTLRQHAGQAAFPGGGSDPGDDGPVATALREAREETGVDPSRLSPLALLEATFIPPSGFRVVPVLAYSPDPGPVWVVDEAETSVVARVPVRELVDPRNRLRVRRDPASGQLAAPAFMLEEMLVWGFTGQVISAMLAVAGWSQPWDTDDVRDLASAMAQLRHPRMPSGGYGDAQP